MIAPEEARWSPGIGDPTAMGWATVAVYFAVTIQCGCNAWQARNAPADRRVWLIITALLTALGINKQLDLQSWFTQAARDLAMAGGWYESRRPLQVGFIVALTLGSALAAKLFHRLAGHRLQGYRLVGCGILGLGAFILARAATFHHVDQLLGAQIGELRVNHVLELGSLGVIWLGALYWRWNIGLTLPRRR